jgi:hypothetical protein
LMLQTQIPWIVLPAVIYMTVILLNKKGVMWNDSLKIKRFSDYADGYVGRELKTYPSH